MIDRIVQGAVSGLLATVPMTAVMTMGHRQLPWHERKPLPPRPITMNVAKAVGLYGHLNEEQKSQMAMAAHYGYGAAAGALFGALSSERSTPGTGKGIVLGLAVWAVSYLALLPALGIFKAASHEPIRRNLLMILAHIVWGISLAQVFQVARTCFSSAQGCHASSSR